ncbi:MAG: LysE family transporter [Kiritimatiellae bacterium]|nr:LysE family transporter [Kiritimatiellia bacterium]MDD5522486.1 LysE family transporter [Kiritimatiellia bacterium]
MSQLFFLFCSAFVITLSGALSPGPVLTATISEVMKRGFWAGPLIMLGHAILEICLLIAIVAGLARWITLPEVMATLGVVGGFLLLVMGTHMALTAKAAVEKALSDHGDSRMAIRGPVLTGIITSISNPYWTLWWATIGLGLAATALKLGAAGIVSFYMGHILSDLAWYSIVSAAVASGRRICPPWVYRALFVFCGLVLVGLGVFFGSTGVAYFV